MGVKRSVRASGMQIKAIKRLWNMFYKSKFQNTDFQNFPLYFLKFPLYNVRGLRGHFPLEFRAHLYVFGISGGRRMGKHTELNLIPTFNFFGPPSIYVLCILLLVVDGCYSEISSNDYEDPLVASHVAGTGCCSISL